MICEWTIVSPGVVVNWLDALPLYQQDPGPLNAPKIVYLVN